MLSKYFEDFDRHILHAGHGRAAGKKGEGEHHLDPQGLMKAFAPLIPAPLVLDTAPIIDTSGYSPDGVDMIAYRPYCPGIRDLLGGYIPCELVAGAYFTAPSLNRASLQQVLHRVVTVKRMNEFATDPESADMARIPCFVIAAAMDNSFIEVKNDIINYYLAKNINHMHEVDLVMILNRGIVIKNWREKRSYVALETNQDTSLWFYVLMAEYLESSNDRVFDLRRYVRKDNIVYTEY